MPEQAHLVESYGTRFTSTSIHRLPEGGFRWERAGGPARTAPLRLPGADAVRAIRGVRAGGLRFALPGGDGERLFYHADGPESLTGLLVRCGPDAYPRAAELLAGLGTSLRHLHSLAVAGDAAGRHAGVARLYEWLIGARASGDAAAPFRDLAARRLGSERWERLQDWCVHFASASGTERLLHGKPGTGAVVPESSGRGALLTGDDLAVGPPDLDVGWVLGELAEFRGVIRARNGLHAALSWSQLGCSFLAGYGPDVPEMTGVAAILAILTHARDYCEFVGWNEWWVAVVLDIIAAESDRFGCGNLIWEFSSME